MANLGRHSWSGYRNACFSGESSNYDYFRHWPVEYSAGTPTGTSTISVALETATAARLIENMRIGPHSLSLHYRDESVNTVQADNSCLSDETMPTGKMSIPLNIILIRILIWYKYLPLHCTVLSIVSKNPRIFLSTLASHQYTSTIDK
jgi:hypothetical protein